MKRALSLFLLGLSLFGCTGNPWNWQWTDHYWKCVTRDSQGDLFLGIADDKLEAIEEARQQCIGGSRYKQSCKAETSYCQPFE